MIRTIKIAFLLLVAAAIGWQCRQKYVSPYVSPPTGYLVVEGYIAGNSPTQFMLSRTIPLPGDTTVPAELGAKLQVEGSDNSVYPLAEQGNGAYGIDTLPLKSSVQYRLRITTSGGEQYLSDPTSFKQTPAIDSVNWTGDASGINIYVNTHDPANASRYYQWNYTETWEYNTAKYSFFKYVPGNPPTVVLRDPSEQIERCWHTYSSTSIFLGSTAKLSQDVVYESPLNRLPPNSQVTSVLYSMLVRQYALTEDAYNYLSLMQKNSTSLGSIFDAQPSELNGNIHCISNPALRVIGYVSAGTISQQRLFIYRRQIVSNYFFNCLAADIFVALSADSLNKYFNPPDPSMIPYTPILKHFNNMGYWDGWIANQSACVDCTLQGGTNQKPSFWPN